MRKNIHIYYDDVLDNELIKWLENKNNWKGYRSRNSFILGMLYNIYGHNNESSIGGAVVDLDTKNNSNMNSNSVTVNDTSSDKFDDKSIDNSTDTTAKNVNSKFLNKFKVL